MRFFNSTASPTIVALLILTTGCAQEQERPPEPAKVPVSSEILTPGAFQPSIRLFGKVEPSARIEIRSPRDGILSYAPRFAGGLRTGERVRAGEVLLTLDNEALRLSLTEHELDLRAAEEELNRAKVGFEAGILPKADLGRAEIAAEKARKRLESLQTQLTRLDVATPDSGTLKVDTVVPPGIEVAAGQLLAEIAGDGKPRVEAWTTPADLDYFQRGAGVECLAAGTDDVIGRGELREIAGQVERGGTMRLVITVDEDLGMPPPGEGLELRVLLAKRETALTLPEEALLIDGGIASVFVLEPKGADYQARQRVVRPGSRADGRIEILDGLDQGERVAIRGAEFLDDGLLAVEADP